VPNIGYNTGVLGDKVQLYPSLEIFLNTLTLFESESTIPRAAVILNAYSLRLSSLILENLLKQKAKENLEIGELFLAATSGVKLPLGVFGRFVKV